MDFERENQERGPTRSGSRTSLFLLTELRSIEGDSLGRARIRNLSATGMMADCERPMETGARIELDLRGIGWVKGTIVWVRDDRIGLSFDHPVDPQMARKPVTGGSGSALPDYLRTHWISRSRETGKS